MSACCSVARKGAIVHSVLGVFVPDREPRRGFCPKARGYAVGGVTPGVGGRVVTTPERVVPMDRTGGLPCSGLVAKWKT